MNPAAILKRTISLITRPNNEWQTIKNESVSVNALFMKYVIILAAIPAIAGMIGYSIIGVSYGFGSFRVPFGRAIIWAVMQYAVSLGGVYVTALIMDALAPKFGSTRKLDDSMKVVVFTLFPVWISGVFYIIPSLSLLSALVSLYSLYLLYLGMKYVKAPPKEKAIPYFLVNLIIMIVIYAVIGSVISTIVFGGMMAVGR